MKSKIKPSLTSFLAGTLFFISSQALQARVIVSDLDDTLKITEVQTANAIWNAIVEQTVFTGMPELLTELKSAESNSELTVVSGSPKILKLLVEDLLYFHKVDYDDVILLGSGSKKPQVLSAIAKATEQSLILVGDDQENDAKFYTDLKKQFPNQVTAIYIHRLNNSSNKPLPQGVTPYFTAYEVALHEATQGRLSLEALERVRLATMKKITDSKYNSEYRRVAVNELFPLWAKCHASDIQKILIPWLKSSLADQHTIRALMEFASVRCNAQRTDKLESAKVQMQPTVNWDSL